MLGCLLASQCFGICGFWFLLPTLPKLNNRSKRIKALSISPREESFQVSSGKWKVKESLFWRSVSIVTYVIWNQSTVNPICTVFSSHFYLTLNAVLKLNSAFCSYLRQWSPMRVLAACHSQADQAPPLYYRKRHRLECVTRQRHMVRVEIMSNGKNKIQCCNFKDVSYPSLGSSEVSALLKVFKKTEARYVTLYSALLEVA